MRGVRRRRKKGRQRGEHVRMLAEGFNAAALCLNVHGADSGGTSLAQGKEMRSAILLPCGEIDKL